MCISLEASFTACAALLPAGLYCTRVAVVQNHKAFLPLAAIPVVFSVQQFSEGLVWLGMERRDSQLILTALLWFLFFALSFWPFWLPVTAVCLETRTTARRIQTCIAVLGFFWSALLYGPLLWNPDWLHVNIVAHSL